MLRVYYLNMNNVLSASNGNSRKKKLLVEYVDSNCGMYLGEIWL